MPRKNNKNSHKKIMTTRQEKLLAHDLQFLKKEFWSSLLGEGAPIESIVEFIFQWPKWSTKLDSEMLFDLLAAAKRLRRRPVKANQSLLDRRKRAAITELVKSDPCMDLAFQIYKYLKTFNENKSYLINLELLWEDFVHFRNEFIERNLGLVVMVSKRYTGYGIPNEDLIQEGIFGLNRAIGTFDPELGFKFSTYAAWWIRAVIGRYCRNHARVVRVPGAVQDQYKRYKSLIGDDPDLTDRQLARLLGVSPKTIESIRSISLDKYKSTEEESDTGAKILDFIPDENDEVSHIESKIDFVSINSVIESLDDRRKYIIRARYGIHGVDEKTLLQISEELSLSRERVRQLEVEIIDDIRKRLNRNKLILAAKLSGG